MRGLDPIGANLRRIISLSVVIVRACGRSSKHGTSHLARLTLNPLSRDYWVPRLKRGMTTERFVARLKLAPMGMDPRVKPRVKPAGDGRGTGARCAHAPCAPSMDPFIALDLAAVHDAPGLGIERVAPVQYGKIVPHQEISGLPPVA